MRLIAPNKLNNHQKLARKQIIMLVFVVYWLLIFEGALRKWVLPQFNQIIFFIRDPFVLTIYWLAWKHKLWPRKSLLLVVGVFLAYLSAILLCLQVMLAEHSFVFGFYGWRNYFLYIPLAFIIGSQFDRDDLNRLLKQTLIISIPIAILVVFQSLAPPYAVINRGISADYAFTPLAGGVLRTQGTFTSTLGQTMFIGSIVAMLLSTLVLPTKERIALGIPLYVATFAVVTNLVVSGSRGAFIMAFTLIFATIASSIFLKSFQQSSKLIIMLAFILLAGAVASQTVFYDQFNALVNRAEGAAQGDAIGSDMLARVLSGFTKFLSISSLVPITGIGLGLGGNARTKLGVELPFYIEDDLSRNIVELGPFIGLAYILLRFAIAIWLFKNALKALFCSNTLLPVLLTTFTAIIFINGILTGHGSVNGYGWLFLGFSIAANNLGQK